MFHFSVLLNFAQSNQIHQKTFTKQDGIGLDIINSLCYDNDGFLWLRGSNLDNRSIIISERKLVLQRFNGHTFHNINLPDYKNQINGVHQIYKRKDGKFYILTQLNDGFRLLLFNPYTAIFKPINFKGFKSDLDGLSKIFSYNNDDYLLIQKGVVISFIKLELDLSFSELFNFTSSETKFIVENSSRIVPFKDFVLISDDNFNTKIFKWDGTLIHDIEKVETNIPLDKRRIIIDEVFIQNNTHYAFLFRNPNLYKIDEAKKSLLLVKNNSLPNDHLNTFNDALGNTLLFSSNKDLLTISSLQNEVIKQYYQLEIKATNSIKITSKDLKKEAWIATNGMLHYLKFPNKIIKNFMPTYEFRNIKPLDSTNYLVATENNGWYTINTMLNTITPYPLTFNSKAFTASTSNLIIEDSIIWGNGNSGIFKVNRKTKNVKIYKHYPITYQEKISDSIIIYATNGYNLMQFNTKSEQHTVLVKTDSLDIPDFHIVDNSNLIVAATNKGLLTYNLNSKKSVFYNNKNDLKDHKCILP